MDKYGTDYFRREAIWDVDWQEKARQYGLKNPEKYVDPRGWLNKIIHLWLKTTQPLYPYSPFRLVLRIKNKLKRLL